MSADKDKLPVTAALRELRNAGISCPVLQYDYVERGGTSRLASELGLDEHLVVKTLIMESSDQSPLVILMHGDRSVSLKNMARFLGVKGVAPCAPAQAERYSGYKCGGTSPFGLRRKMPVYIEKSILDLPFFYINGGLRGLVLRLTPADLLRVLQPTPVQVAIEALD
ncbi:MAG: Cys-tRNA(Pro) deacylase [Oligosphaeraceae bacterium]|jgi:Cys-tRNA(Pro) deacylase|nr:Cys-tRNA(Pro) deacylase [Oligosphaeraceae bacterium]